MNTILLSEIAAHVQGELVGYDRPVSGVREIQHAGPEHITFFLNSKYQKYLTTTQAAAVLVDRHHPQCPAAQIIVSDTYYAYSRVLWLFHPPRKPVDILPSHIHPEAHVAEDAIVSGALVARGATIESGCVIHPGVHVGEGVTIGKNCLIYPGVVIYAGCHIGSNVIVHANSVLGCDGYGYATHQGVHHKIPHVGTLVIEDDVEIGGSTVIDRAVLGEARIGRGTKIDNLVHIGHNARIGAHCFITAQCGFAGSATIGDYVALGGQCGINGHLNVASRTMFAAKSGITKSIDEPGTYAGYPAVPQKQWQREVAGIRRLDALQKKVQQLESTLAALLERNAHERD
ncbi:UDP-3-O-(3-hydroxymyristoyl)glucosamine N-acyltransferase [Desulfurispirillum indicum]|uniref:UDP-3-O-acylglucosamine N-acyltransferase n=1 Tax=Desulfurispirillum indicum (strain ATCC BAA-1389 / DSM 22839 / S5) TaxID=653733 RepID=E6W0D2_DESIS|nr:UDP-3-O-(3-hydroxymyristoyl)glucosamine N-acyltransferase [Desulfurispirillum indicum]ADU66350.1 UDP-3-O-(3-hydroxymyristoyl) glucosamine N-acyltransferase [Desulfurispirillum indicum S5]UCZ55684.1 UDP-3-O-(3-hydroxymyristoyl)glucosamine N-acyltransferase [Desulfurispirillum indicum]